MIIHLDYETRSRVDLTSSGAHRYACDPSTEILMAGVSTDQSDEVLLWVNPKFRTPDMLGDNERVESLLHQGELFYAHNAPFEQAISWGNNLTENRLPLLWFPINRQFLESRWRCTAAMARKAGLPASLEKCAEALGLEQKKDARGKQLIRFFSIPKPDGMFNNPLQFPEEWAAFGDYCRQDVRTEKAVHQALKVFELQGPPLETFLFDLRMNMRGIPVNMPALKNAQAIIEKVQARVTAEFQKLTGLNPTQREAVRQLLGMSNMQAETVENTLERLKVDAESHYHLGETVKYLEVERTRNILTLYQQVSYAATKKIATMLDWACPDGRMRGVFKYYGAGTGRWSAGGPQMQNAKKPTPEMRSLTDAAYAYISRGGSAEGLEAVYGDPLEVISSCIRHFVHDPKAPLLDGDYNAIEARIICWLAGQQDILNLWREVDAGDESKHPYKVMASRIYGVPVTSVTKDQRVLGKTAELGCGFQMGAPKFFATCENFHVACTADMAETTVEAYRESHDKVVRYWYYLNEQARKAIMAPGHEAGPFVVRKIAGIGFLLFRLRSGRSLAYPHPKIEVLPGEDREQITYWGQLPSTVSWGRVKLYGGKLAENETQATAADIMAYGALEAERQGMPPFALIHDQALASKKEGCTADKFAAAMSTLPPWAAGLPIKVEAAEVPYYSK